MKRVLRDICRDNRGVAALEYALIAGMIFVVIVTAGGINASKLSTAITYLGQSLTAHSTLGT